MGEHLIKPYEISVWEDKLTQDGFIENKLAVIGSNTMTGLNKVYNPIFHKSANGEKTLSFSLKYQYFDPYSGNQVINPFVGLLTNERKVKLYYDNSWYEFIVKDHTELSEELEWTYTCTDAFVLELSKIGYNITFDEELNNNQGTAEELAAEKIISVGNLLLNQFIKQLYYLLLVLKLLIQIIQKKLFQVVLLFIYFIVMLKIKMVNLFNLLFEIIIENIK